MVLCTFVYNFLDMRVLIFKCVQFITWLVAVIHQDGSRTWHMVVSLADLLLKGHKQNQQEETCMQEAEGNQAQLAACSLGGAQTEHTSFCPALNWATGVRQLTWEAH